MIREGEPQVTLKFLADSPSKLAISNFSDGTLKQFAVTTVHIHFHEKKRLYEAHLDEGY